MVAKDWHEQARSTEQMYGQVFGAVSQVPGLRVFPRLDPPLPTPGQYDVELVLQSDAGPADARDGWCGSRRGMAEREIPVRDTDLKSISLKRACPGPEGVWLIWGSTSRASAGNWARLLGGAYVNRFNYFDRSYKVFRRSVTKIARRWNRSWISRSKRRPVNSCRCQTSRTSKRAQGPAP